MQTQIQGQHLAEARRLSLRQFYLPRIDLGIVLLLRQGEKTKMLMLKREWLDLGSRNRQDVLSAGRGGLHFFVVVPPIPPPFFW